ncbi:hypothetical protein [Natronorubrum halophilum]|uniref:hypothetical protein n=1 Tax=Natronorubrum halophilum TaxID=1702106 RepID=UPI0010C1BCEF|nr:hypothetical protein [Natronorubrum halophilum]
MSTDDHHAFGWQPTIDTVLEHPLIGVERRRTRVAIGFLAVFVGLFVVSYAGSVLTVNGEALETLTERFDMVSTVLIALAAAAVTIVPFLYATWNGGPALSFALPLVPVTLGHMAAGQYVLGLDTVIALTVGSAASALALFAADIRRTGSLRPWNAGSRDESQLLFVTMLTVVAAVSASQFVAGAPPRSLELYLPFSVLWFASLGIVGAYWQAAIRTTVAARLKRGRSES